VTTADHTSQDVVTRRVTAQNPRHFMCLGDILATFGDMAQLRHPSYDGCDAWKYTCSKSNYGATYNYLQRVDDENSSIHFFVQFEHLHLAVVGDFVTLWASCIFDLWGGWGALYCTIQEREYYLCWIEARTDYHDIVQCCCCCC